MARVSKAALLRRTGLGANQPPNPDGVLRPGAELIAAGHLRQVKAALTGVVVGLQRGDSCADLCTVPLAPELSLGAPG